MTGTSAILANEADGDDGEGAEINFSFARDSRVWRAGRRKPTDHARPANWRAGPQFFHQFSCQSQRELRLRRSPSR